MLRTMLPARSDARWILLGTLFSALGRGLTLPFLFIYLTKVREVSSEHGRPAGRLDGRGRRWRWRRSAAALIDRFGARRYVSLPLPASRPRAVGLAGVRAARWPVPGSR